MDNRTSWVGSAGADQAMTDAYRVSGIASIASSRLGTPESEQSLAVGPKEVTSVEG